MCYAYAAPPTASTICVYNDAAFVLKWHLTNKDTGASSAETGAYPVLQTQCLSASSFAPDGSAIVPVIKAVWGDEITANEIALVDSANATQITYVCKGTTLDFSCSQQPAPVPLGNVTKEIGEFMLGFVEGLGTQMGFTDCIQVTLLHTE